MVEAEGPVVDHQRCVVCGLCVGICPDRVIHADQGGRVQIEATGCMLCGHCAAVCPADAITIAGLRSTDGFKVFPAGEQHPDAAIIKPAGLVRLMRERRSCRQFTARPVDLALLEDLVKIGTTAPSGTNSQKWQFIILPERAEVERLGAATAAYYQRLNRLAANRWIRLAVRLLKGDGLDRYYRDYYQTVQQGLNEWRQHRVDRLFHGAPSALVIAAEQSASCPSEDCLLASQNILLAAQSIGLGTCLIGFVVEAARRDRRIGRLLGLAADERIYSVIAVGHPAVKFSRAAGRRPVQPRIFGGTTR